MKNLSLFSILISFLVTIPILASGQDKIKKYELNLSKSYLKWVASDGEENEYTGTFDLKSGYVMLADEALDQLVVFVNMQSFECRKCESNEAAQKITQYVKSEPFFNSRNMDFATFKMYESSPLENDKNGNFRIKGQLTIKGYTHDVELPVMITTEKDKLTGDGGFTMNRRLWKLDNPTDNEKVYSMSYTVKLLVHLEGEYAK